MFLAWFLFSFSSVSVGAPASLPDALLAVQREYQKNAGVTAEFEQRTDIKATKSKKTAQGRIWIKRPDKIRWETLSPDPNILISDGKTFWFYTPPFEKGERGQVIIKTSAQVQTRFLNALLSGTFDFGKGQAEITEKSKSVFLLKPKAGTAGDVSLATLILSTTGNKIEQVILDHTSGNRTEIQLKEIRLTASLEEKLFRYTHDKNTDKIVE